jgi:hypothetical protein
MKGERGVVLERVPGPPTVTGTVIERNAVGVAC